MQVRNMDSTQKACEGAEIGVQGGLEQSTIFEIRPMYGLSEDPLEYSQCAYMVIDECISIAY
jgi:hypothetical protein